MISTNELKRGVRVEIDGEPFVVVDCSMQSASARSSNTFLRVKLRNLRNGQLLDRSVKSGERLKVPDFEIRTAQYLYAEGQEAFVFMDQSSYDQLTLDRSQVGDAMGYVRPNDEVRALFFNGACIGIEVAPTVVLEVTDTEPAVRGDTVNNVTKAATLETGLEVQVPLFVGAGDRVVVDTRDAHYVRRA